MKFVKAKPAENQGLRGRKRFVVMMSLLILVSVLYDLVEAQTWREFDMSSISVDWEVDRNGKIYATSDYSYFLLVSDMLGELILLHAKSDSVFTYGPATVETNEETYSASFNMNQPRNYRGQTLRIESDIKFPITDKSVYIVPRPDIIGEVTFDGLMQYKVIYRQLAAMYSPDETAIAYLKGYASSVTVRVVFGSWCSNCQKKLPEILKVVAETGNSNITFSYIGIDDKFSIAELKERYGIQKLPGITIFKGQNEIGKIESVFNESFEKHLVSILKDQ
jgi:thiol-disulfide isomerase/thioredoxin